MFDPNPTAKRKTRSFTLLPSTIDRVEALAKSYDTNASRIVEALITQYGPKLLAHNEKEAK